MQQAVTLKLEDEYGVPQSRESEELDKDGLCR